MLKKALSSILKKLESFSSKHKIITNIVFYGIILSGILLTFYRCFDNVLWLDESFTANIVKNDFFKITAGTAIDSHPPLYYYIVKIFISIFQENGFILHFISFIPYLLIIIIGYIVLNKKYGKKSYLLFFIFSTISSASMTYNVEIRMYSWAALFILLAILTAKKCYKDNKLRHFLLLSVFLLLSSYTHYYCLIMSFCIVLAIFISQLIKKKSIKNTIVAAIVCILGYIPWGSVLITSFGRHATSWWATSIPTLTESLTFAFSKNYSIFLLSAFILLIGLLFSIGYLIKEGSHKFVLDFKAKNLKIDSETFLVLTTISTFLFTIIVGTLISKAIRPLYLIRYLFPLCPALYMSIAIELKSIKISNLLKYLVIILITILLVPNAKQIFETDIAYKQRHEETQKLLNDKYGDHTTYIWNNNDSLRWGTLQYYYPNSTIMFEKNEEKLLSQNSDKPSLIIFTKKLSDDTIKKKNLKLVSENGMISHYKAYIYISK